MNPVLVAGTDSWSDSGHCDWYCPGSPFAQFLTAHGCAPTFDGRPDASSARHAQPFVWSTDLSGVSLLPSRRRVDWAAGGAALYYFVAMQQLLAGQETAIIAHSHGLQVVLFACAEHDLKVATLITVGSPVRSDMRETARKARPNIGRWLAIHSDHTDYWQWLGELCSGGLLTREQPLADVNGFAPHVGHSALLREATTFPYWATNEWLGWLADRPQDPPAPPLNVSITKGVG